MLAVTGILLGVFLSGGRGGGGDNNCRRNDTNGNETNRNLTNRNDTNIFPEPLTNDFSCQTSVKEILQLSKATSCKTITQ